MVNVTTAVVFFAFVGAIVYFSAFFQQVQGRSPIAAGLDVAAVGIAWAITAPLSGRLVAVTGERWPLMTGLLLSGAATLGLLRQQAATRSAPSGGTSPCWARAWACPAPPAARSPCPRWPPPGPGMASAVNNASRQIGQVFGVAVLGALVYAGLPGGSGTGGRLDPARQAAFVTGLHHALWVSGLALLAAAALTGLLFTQRAATLAPQ